MSILQPALSPPLDLPQICRPITISRLQILIGSTPYSKQERSRTDRALDSKSATECSLNVINGRITKFCSWYAALPRTGILEPRSWHRGKGGATPLSRSRWMQRFLSFLKSSPSSLERLHRETGHNLGPDQRC